MMTRRALILANGPIDDPDVIRARLSAWKDARVIAADGGQRYASELGLRLDALVGDLDSTDPAAVERIRSHDTAVARFPAQKDETDLELALLHAARDRAEAIAVIGATGGRLDMTLANVLLLLHPLLAHIDVQLWKDNQTAWVLRPPGGAIQGQAGDTLSLLPLGGDATGITSEGLAYRLEDASLSLGPARGVSNELVDSTARIRMLSGVLIVVHTPGRDQEAQDEA
jgi:thiamine pyrophosphokinase